MKILMLTPYLPYPPSSGGQIRTFNLLKYLSKNNRITLISLYKKPEEKKYLKYLEKYCYKIYACKRAEKPWQLKTILEAIFFPYPFLIVRNFSPEAKKIVEDLLKQETFDVIHAETFYIMPHLPKTKTPILLVEQTIEYKVYQHFVNSRLSFIKPFFYFDILKLKQWERFFWKKANLVATVSESDKEKILALEPEINPTVIPNGAGEEMMKISLVEKDLSKPILLFIGNFFWLQNVEAANILINEIYPLLIHDNLKIIIAGQNAKNKLKDIKSKNIQIIDINPDDTNKVKELYQKATLFIAPIKGPGGTRLKILAAMATGLPIISTKIGVEGLGLYDNINILIAEEPQEFIKKIHLILSDKALFKRIQNNSYNFVRKNFNWEKIASQLEHAYSQIKNYDPLNENRN